MNSVRQIIEALKGLLVWWVTVAPWERALRVRLGRHVALLEPGVHLRIPIVDRVFRQSIRRRASNQAAQTLVTKDGRSLTVAVTVLYRIADLRLLYDTLHHPEGTIAGIVLGCVGRWVVEHDASEVTPAALCEEVSRMADLERYGLAEVELAVNTFAFVRTFRFITGDGHGWHTGDLLDTAREDSEASPS